ncbi:CshA/CshB family fibrillar adhesin-related protein [Nocardioides sp. TF02-7]|uniref:CshA/CshB family fibrillar adhesin-related protein n=1 Tax=Nocardioides sp. TF02-7 TaxID=2917724 RepID=UPI0031F574C7
MRSSRRLGRHRILSPARRADGARHRAGDHRGHPDPRPRRWASIVTALVVGSAGLLTSAPGAVADGELPPTDPPPVVETADGSEEPAPEVEDEPTDGDAESSDDAAPDEDAAPTDEDTEPTSEETQDPDEGTEDDATAEASDDATTETDAGAPGVAPMRFADGGAGLYQGSIDWFEWGSHGQSISNGATRTNTRTVAGQELVTSCTISDLAGEIFAYRPGSYSGDGLDDLYNIGGTGSNNQLIAGLSTRNGGLVDFDFDCSVTRDGEAVPLAGLVIADAEASVAGSAQGEFVQATAPAGATWRVIDRYRPEGCTADAVIDRTGQTLRFTGSTQPVCATYPTAVGFMDGASSADVRVQGAASRRSPSVSCCSPTSATRPSSTARRAPSTPRRSAGARCPRAPPPPSVSRSRRRDSPGRDSAAP